MARLESIAVGGYFPTPDRVVGLITELLRVPKGDYGRSVRVNVVDPCAGDGAAAFGVAQAIGAKGGDASVYAVELEHTRHAALQERARKAGWRDGDNALHGDAFLVDVRKAENGAHLLYLNPPYDLDPVHARLEERFLSRFTSLLDKDGGLLVFVVPHYALAASAATLALEYDVVSEADGIGCYRFPDPEWSAFKQVVLFARKVPARLEPDPAIVAQVERWASSVADCPVLGDTTAPETIDVLGESWASHMTWKLEQFDVAGVLARVRPWTSRARPGTPGALVPHVLSELPVRDLSFRSYPLATPPRPAHIAAGIASGLFNGRRVSAPGKPDLLVKGVFDKEYKTIEEKKNKDGETTGVVQIQQPKLVTTVLDLSTSTYSTLDAVGLTTLLDDYGSALMGVMREQCPVLYDPQRDADAVSLAPVARNLYAAQAHAARALVALLTRGDRCAILLGEIGSGKTGTALTAAKTATPGARVLVLCPPHLLTSWKNEAKTVVPEAPVCVLESVQDVDDFAAAPVPAGSIAIAVLSRETAKLGHGVAGVGSGACPGCGAPLPPVPVGDLARKRLRCSARARTPANWAARAAEQLALRLAPSAPKNDRVVSLHGSRRHLGRVLRAWTARAEAGAAPTWPGFDQRWTSRIVKKLVAHVLAGATHDDPALGALGHLATTLTPAELRKLLSRLAGGEAWGVQADVRRALALFLPPNDPEQVSAWAGQSMYSPSLETVLARLQDPEEGGFPTRLGRLSPKGVDGHAPGSSGAATQVLVALCAAGKWSAEPECGTPLFQAIPEPRRVPLATYIARRHPRAFGLLILDEGHEYATDGSAQERAAHRLTGLGLPTILATGSIMNGYAASLFTNMWALSADFRHEFARDEGSRFVDRYGYRKRILSEKDKQTGKIVAFGSMTDRVERTERAAGDAPGVLPLFLFRHLLSISVTLHKTDLALDLPPCRQIRHDIEPGEELGQEYRQLLAALKRQIKADQFKEDRSGKLFGQLSELPSYLDRAFRDYEVRYPESVDGGAVIARADAITGMSAKEEWLLETLRAELAEGRNCMVFCWHIDVLPRLQRLIQSELGEEAPILLADKVATGKRQDWIDAKIVKPRRRVMLANPVCIQTGLNNLVWFATEIWIENPACNPTIFRQAVGRIDRIGQRAGETRVHLPVYAGTLQASMLDLLLRKVAVATSADGLDPESALAAAGAGEQDGFLAGLSLGKALWEMMSAEPTSTAKPRPRKRAPARRAPAVVAPKGIDLGAIWVTRAADAAEMAHTHPRK
jgi:hypothetical protein